MGSPFRSTRHDPYSLSSSPGLPSLDQLKSQFPTNPPIRSGSTAAPLPWPASHHVANASSFFPQEHSAIDLTTPCKQSIEAPIPHVEEEVTVISISTLTSKPKRKRGAKVLEKKAHEPPLKFTKNADASPPLTKHAKPKAPAEKQEKKPKVAKPKTATKKGEVTSRHFAKPKDGEEESPPLPKKNADEPLELEKALRRRVDWTPPPADSGLAFESKSPQTAKSPSLIAGKDTFGNLLKDFGREDGEAKPPSVTLPDGNAKVTRKRKLIGTVSTNDSSNAAPQEKSVTKAKAPRKKPRTITELATAAYVIPDATEQEAPSALQGVEDDGDTGKLPGKPSKRASKTKKPKKAPPPEPILLSPTTALRQAANQDYVFGTSSQLAREHSPTFLRDLQRAVQASNSMKDEDPFVTPINSDAIEPEPRQKLWDFGARDEDGRLLDLEVINLADTPQVNAGAPDGPDPFGYAVVGKRPSSPPAYIMSDASFPDIDDLLGKETSGGMIGGQKEMPPMLPTAGPAEEQPYPAEAVLVSSGTTPHAEEEAPDLPPARLSSTAGEVLPKSTAVANPIAEPPKPDFGLYTDNQLAREIASYGFKPVKRRQAMLALLDQCWVSKQRTALASLPTNHPISTTSQAQAAAKPQKPAATASPKRPRGRPRKDSNVELPSSEPPPSAQPPPPSPKRGRGRPKKTAEPAKASGSAASKKGKSKASTAVPAISKAVPAAASPSRKKPKASEVIEIPDSASDGSLSPSPYSSPEPAVFSPPPDDVSVSIGEDAEMTLAAPPTGQQSASLFAHITEAVTMAPPTTDPKQPSFHEMMLMYDPIVLEDLAAWLNTGQLSRVGYDGEVSANEVKQWCESKSVCCLWRESLRGKERKRY